VSILEVTGRANIDNQDRFAIIETLLELLRRNAWGVGAGGSGVALGATVGVRVGAGGSGVALGATVEVGVGARGSGVVVGATDTDETPHEIKSDASSIKQEI
jgi:hypothetical protein